MKKNYTLFSKTAFVFSLLLLSSLANAQHFTATLANFTSTSNTFEVDVVLIVDAPTQGVRLTSFSTGINFNPAILNGGTPCTTNDCGSWEYIPGTRSTQLLPLRATVNNNRANPGHLRIMQLNHTLTTVPPITSLGVDLLPGSYTLGRYRFTNTVNWTPNTDAGLWLMPTNTGGATNTIVCFYPYGQTTPMSAYTTTVPDGTPGVTLGYTESMPMARMLNVTLGTPENNIHPLQVSPNPFSTAFNLDFETVSNEQVSIKVYDMLGKLIESRTLEATAVNTTQLGTAYPSGIYNVVVAQGEKSQNARVIKR